MRNEEPAGPKAQPTAGASSANPNRITSKPAYLKRFAEHHKAALDRAHDIRKFEIELYWKRATYFWAFNAAALAGYVALNKEAGDQANVFLICCLGFIFSTAWYIVNRGSSYWQRNWEKHVDLLEDETEGPLHKLVIERTHFPLADLTGPYRFSPARTNTVLALFLVVLWIALAAKTAFSNRVEIDFRYQVVALAILTISAAFLMVWKGRSGRKSERRKVDLVMREYE